MSKKKKIFTTDKRHNPDVRTNCMLGSLVEWSDGGWHGKCIIVGFMKHKWLSATDDSDVIGEHKYNDPRYKVGGFTVVDKIK